MAAELLLLGNSAFAPLLLIEEPEAHLHPQLQTRITDLLRERAETATTAGDTAGPGHPHHPSRTWPRPSRWNTSPSSPVGPPSAWPHG
ncbi:AAA family ATPase [Streptomyces sp. NPDC006140]